MSEKPHIETPERETILDVVPARFARSLFESAPEKRVPSIFNS